MRHPSFLPPSLLACALALAACQPQGDAAEAPAPAAVAAVESAATRLNPLASASDEVMAAGKRLLAAGSYHARIVTSDGAQDFAMEVDYVAPDRYRMVMPLVTQVIIGDTMHMTMQGRSMQMQVPPGTTEQWRDPNRLGQYADSMQVESLGSDSVDGKDARKYLTRYTDQALKPVTTWIDADGYPLRIEVDSELQGKPATTVITYSRFNDPSIRVEAP
ncbi:MAG TPA: hypothetical protein PK743_10445 [Luteimonas sp.]|nr:hypothetical protein [Luteimonas sp.]HRP73041.1 hypothetical protein [Luteimonas sp.]